MNYQGLIFRQTAFLFILFCFYIQAKAQLNNEEALVKIIKEFRELDHRPVGELSGFTTSEIVGLVKLKMGTTTRMHLDPPIISFQKISRKSYLRKISINLIYRDSTEQDFHLSSQDTLSKNQIKFVRKTKHRELRGENPLFFGRVLAPILGISVGLVGILALFYVRS